MKGIAISRLAPLLLTAIFLLAIFVVPYRCPGVAPSCSASWEFGFSNNAARGLIALLLLCLLACRFLSNHRPSPASPLGRVILDQPEGRSLRPLLVAMAAFQVASTLILTAWYRFLPYAHYGEMTYFIQRLDLMTLGRQPYLDFGFNYGPAMLWMPAFFYRASHQVLSIEAAYFATLLIHYVLGFALLAYTVSQVRSRVPALLFTLLAFPFLNLTMGLNYAPLRFVIAPASIFAVRHLCRAMPGFPFRRGLALSLAAFFLPVINCAVSPEMGLAAIAGLCVFFLWFLLRPGRLTALFCLPVIAGAGAVAILFPRGYFDAIFSYGGGVADFSLLPTVHLLAMLAAAIWILPWLGVAAFRGNDSAAPFCAGLAVLLGVLLIPATGRCDGGHVFCNSFGLFLLPLAAATFLAARWRYGLLAAYFVIFPVMGLIAFWNDYQPAFARAVLARRQLARLSYASDNGSPAPGLAAPPFHSSKLLPVDPWLAGLPQVPIGLPLGADEVTERFLILTGRALPEYYVAPHADLYAPGELTRKFADLRRMTTIYVPDFYLKYLKPVNPDAQAAAQARDDNAFLSKLLLLPVNLTPVNPTFQPDAVVMNRIAHEYALLKRCPAGLLLKRKD